MCPVKSDHSAQPCNLIRDFKGQSVSSQRSKASADGQSSLGEHAFYGV